MDKKKTLDAVAKHNQEFDGLVWILDGRVHVKNELKHGMPPLINPCEGVKLFINGVERNHLVAVSEKDVITLVPVESDSDFKFDIELSEDELQAYAIYTPPQKLKRIIVDKYPINKLDVEVTEILLETKKITKEDIYNEITRQGVVYGIIESILEQIVKENKAGRYLIAEGKPVVEPVDDWVEYYFTEDVNKVNLDNEAEDNVDFRNIFDYTSVRAGEVIAKYNKGTLGISGISVTGKEIHAREPNVISINSSNAIIIDNETGLIRANKHGRPSKLLKNNLVTINIFDKLQTDEVSIKTGNIRFKGDVEVSGNVMESMEVNAKQSVEIKGNVNFASVFAGNNITIKGGLISSRIFTGVSDFFAKDPTPEIKRIIVQIESLEENIGKFSASEANELKLKGMPDIVRYLLNLKNKDLTPTVYEVMHALRKGSYDIDQDSLLRLLKVSRIFLGDCSEIKSLENIHTIREMVKSLVYDKEEIKPSGNISLNYVLNSEVSALGNIVITGKGCFNSRLISKGKVIINGTVRAGEIYAEKNIEVNKAGSELGAKTYLSVPEKGSISIKLAYADTFIRLGSYAHQFLKEQKNVNAKVANRKIVF